MIVGACHGMEDMQERKSLNFTHLHVHTEYSLLDGSGKIKEMVLRAKELGMDSLAITDHGVMYGVIDFYRMCKQEGIRPILGCEVYVSPGSRFDKESGENDERYYHLVLLAENNQGYANLMKIVSRGFTEGFYYKPRVDYEILSKYSEGIIALSACLGGEVAILLRRGFYEEAKQAALKMQGVFGKNNYFLELQDHGIPEQNTVNQGLLRMHEETGIPMVATNDIHYVLPEDAEAHDILLCIQTQKKVTDEDRMRYTGGQYYMKSPEEMEKLFSYAKEAIQNTWEIAQRCSVEIVFGEYKLPRFDVPDNFSAYDYLVKLCVEGLERRYPNPSQELRDRLAYEIETIRSMGFVDYFLIVSDFIRFAKSKGIAVGPGRGSAAGSIVSYCLEITDIDPIRYQLLFERFLNPERVTMPDIDIDFCYERRQEVIDYVVEKYGKNQVVQIITFGTLAARNAIRDVGRALDMPYAKVDTIAKMIPTELNITINKALEMNQEFSAMYRDDREIGHLVDMAKRLEGLPRHSSIHAAGVVISNAPVEEYVPLSRGSEDTITTQFTMTTLEELGLLKMDFLGLRTLTVIQDAVKQINKNRPPENQLDMDTIDYSDKAVYDMISAGKTEGVFQLESSGMTSFMKELKPQNMEDIIAGISLYRPGPMDFIPQYVKGKNNQDSITYDCPQLEPILAPTYGCIVYQEQVMQIVRELAGYSFGRSDLLRRAMSKKKASVMEKERAFFVYGNPEENVPGCVANGIPEATANIIYDRMTDFAKYAFNKSHAAAYAVLAFQTAYLRYYFPVEFMAALMTSIMGNTAKVAAYIYVCRKMGIGILPPDINVGEYAFTADGKNIRYALASIRSVGRPVIDALVQEREENGPYTSLKDFFTRLSSREVNKRTVENFIKAGAFSSLPGTRRQQMNVYAQVLEEVTMERKVATTGQLSLLDFMGVEEKKDFELKLPEIGEYTHEQLLAFEKEVLGIYISGHPLDAYRGLLEKNTNAVTSDFILDEETNDTVVQDGQVVTVGGIIIDRTTKTTRTGSVMAFITLEDMQGQLEILVFPKDYERNRSVLELDRRVLITGRVNSEDEKDAKLICQAVIPFEEIPRLLYIKFPDKDSYLAEEKHLLEELAGFDGNDTVVIYCEKEKAKKELPKNRNVQIDTVLLGRLYSLYKEENVKVVDKTSEKKGTGNYGYRSR